MKKRIGKIVYWAACFILTSGLSTYAAESRIAVPYSDLDLGHESREVEHRCLRPGMHEQVDIGGGAGGAAGDGAEHADLAQTSRGSGHEDQCARSTQSLERRNPQHGVEALRRLHRRRPPASLVSGDVRLRDARSRRELTLRQAGLLPPTP